jgi:hypothetical protein
MRPYRAKEAREKLQINRSKFYKLVQDGTIIAIPQPKSPHNLYDRESVDRLALEMQQFRDAINGEEGNTEALTFRQATPDDMDGVYAVAHELFGHTTSVAQRKPMVMSCPQGNYVVLQGSEIVAYVHILPLPSETLEAFMKGKIRGWDITAKNLDCFVSGKEVECLVKSIGATGRYGEEAQRKFARRLLSGTVREMIEMGNNGVIIKKLYATSSKGQGIRLCYSADMEFYSKPMGDRLTFVVDVLNSDNPTFKRYYNALKVWQAANSVA